MPCLWLDELTFDNTCGTHKYYIKLFLLIFYSRKKKITKKNIPSKARSTISGDGLYL